MLFVIRWCAGWRIGGNYRYSLCTCEKTAESGALCTTPQPTRSGRFNLFLGSEAPSAQRASTVDFITHIFDIYSHLFSSLLPPSHPIFRRTYFGSISSIPKMDPSLSTLYIIVCSIYCDGPGWIRWKKWQLRRRQRRRRPTATKTKTRDN